MSKLEENNIEIIELADENTSPEAPASGVMDEDYSEKIRKPKRNKRKKKGSFTLGLVLGLAGGFLVTVVGSNLLLTGYTKNSGNAIVISKGALSLTSDSGLLNEEAEEKINELMSYVDYYYTGDVDEDVIRDEIYHAVLNGLGDPYSVYYTAEEYEDLQVDTGGEYYGIGAGLAQDATTMEVTVSKVYSGTPSEEAGLKQGDIIATVDDVDATSMELSKLVQLIRGEEGTTVHLVIYRDGEEMEFDVERRNITLPSVEGQMLDDNMGYIQISEFQNKTDEQFEEIYQDLADQGMEGVIIDVRANPGGMLDTVVNILDYMLPEGTLVYTEDKYGKQEVFSSDESCVDPIPTVVLVDGNSASASEIFAGALKDYEYATLVGTTTFGKGIVQSVFPLPDGDAVKITTAKYYTPNGNYIHGVGIDPDVELEYEFTGPEDATTYEMQYDNQLQKAIEVLKEAMGQ